MVRYNTTNGAFEGYASGAWSGIGGGAVTDKITQASHAFVVGDVLYMNGATYAKARADVTSTAEVVGMVSRVIDANNFELTLNGEVSGLAGLTAGENYFLDAATAGAITATEPSVVGQVSLPVGVASSTTTFYVAIKRGTVVGAANARTTISLAQSATTTVQNAGAYEAGELTGWIFIDATTDRRFYVAAQFAKNGAGSDYNLSFQTTGETPPAGFNVTITAAGLIQVTLPAIAGFTAANINFALNAPAVGATLPLQISGANVTGPVLGSTTGAAPAAGYVGQRIDSETIIATTINLTKTYAQKSGGTDATLTLPPGTWQVYANFQSLVTSGATINNFSYVIWAIRNDTDATDLSDTVRITYAKTPAAVAFSMYAPVALGTTVNLTTTKIFKLGGTRIDGSGTGSATLDIAGSWTAQFYAIRIA
jgi:hypothetical protein